MKRVSILNHVIGPIMRGPSSSHTAGPWRIGRVARNLLGSKPTFARFSIHPTSSLSVCYHDQGSDLALLSGLLNIPLTDDRFPEMLKLAPAMGLDARFELDPFPEADHPNSVLVCLRGENGGNLTLHARSVGGGSIEIASIDGHPVMMKGDRHELLVEVGPDDPAERLLALLRSWDPEVRHTADGSRCLFHASSCSEPDEGLLETLRSYIDGAHIRISKPVMAPLKGEELFEDTASLLELAEIKGWSLGQAALAYEEALLGAPVEELTREMELRLDVMLEAVEKGLSLTGGMKLLRPMAGSLLKAESAGTLVVGGPHFRAASRAMAAMHVNGAGGVVCAAPTGGSAGVIPGVLFTLIRDLGISRKKAVQALWAAGAIGLALDRRSTFAAEVCGCQVEIGAAGAMGAAAVVEAAGGTARQACDAAATVFQNTMGSVCDLVQGIVEVPCHSRNASLASMAFLCADLALGGYASPVPLDETIDAVDSVGRMLPEELRCTARGGLALCPSARVMPRLDRL
jgi:L-serine dehydratase